MSDNLAAWIGLAVFVAFAVLRGLYRALRRGQGAGQLPRMNAAARKVLRQQSARSPVPITQPKGSPRKTAAPQKALAPAAFLAKPRTPAVIRRDGLLSGKEPVIQRRR